jgi:LAS superfamily LD-carboxypeptidase LdcB
MAFPVRTVVEPAVLAGTLNGRLPASILVSTPGQAGGPAVVLVEPAARAWRALAAAAKEAGHTLKISGPASGYRTYAEQERLFRQRFTTRPVSSTRRYWEGQWWYLRPGMALAAVPGTSNHGRGIAVDTGEERDGDTGTESVDAETVKWLVKNEERFGFSHEVQSEPWHLRYWAGDRIPAAVTYYELSLNPSEEDDMPTIIECTGKPTRLLDAPTCAVIDGPTRDSWKRAGAKTVTYTPGSYDALLAHVEEALGRKVVDAVKAA